GEDANPLGTPDLMGSDGQTVGAGEGLVVGAPAEELDRVDVELDPELVTEGPGPLEGLEDARLVACRQESQERSAAELSGLLELFEGRSDRLELDGAVRARRDEANGPTAGAVLFGHLADRGVLEPGGDNRTRP